MASRSHTTSDAGGARAPRTLRREAWRVEVARDGERRLGDDDDDVEDGDGVGSAKICLEARWECRADLEQQSSVRLAVIAHPYGSLGGNHDDGVVRAVSRTLLQLPRSAGSARERRSDTGASSYAAAAPEAVDQASAAPFVVVSFNSRGVGGSEGKASWTGEVEAADYHAVLRRALRRCRQMEQYHVVEAFAIGYSAGSVYASAAHLGRLGPAPLEAPRTPTSSSALVSPGSGPSSSGGRGGVGGGGEAASSVTLHHLLISYPLDKLWMLSAMRSSRWLRRVEALLQSTEDVPSATPRTAGARLGVVYGTRDQFTSVKSYRRWSARLQELASASPLPPTLPTTRSHGDGGAVGATSAAPRHSEPTPSGHVPADGAPPPTPIAPSPTSRAPPTFEWAEVEHADHFWSSPLETRQELCDFVERFVDARPRSGSG